MKKLKNIYLSILPILVLAMWVLDIIRIVFGNNFQTLLEKHGVVVSVIALILSQVISLGIYIGAFYLIQYLSNKFIK